MNKKIIKLTLLFLGLLILVGFVTWHYFDTVIVAWVGIVLSFIKGFTLKRGFAIIGILIVRQTATILRKSLIVYWIVAWCPKSWKVKIRHISRNTLAYVYHWNVKIRTLGRKIFGQELATVIAIVVSVGIFVFAFTMWGAWLIFIGWDRVKRFALWALGPVMKPAIKFLEGTFFGALIKKNYGILFSKIKHLPAIDQVIDWNRRRSYRHAKWAMRIQGKVPKSPNRTGNKSKATPSDSTADP